MYSNRLVIVVAVNVEMFEVSVCQDHHRSYCLLVHIFLKSSYVMMVTQKSCTLHDILWYTVVYCGILWYTVVYMCTFLLLCHCHCLHRNKNTSSSELTTSVNHCTEHASASTSYARATDAQEMLV